MPIDPNIHLTDEVLADFLSGDLSPEREASLHDHLQSCAECQETFGDLFAVRDMLAFAPDVPSAIPSESMWNGIASRLDLERRPEPTPLSQHLTAKPESRLPQMLKIAAVIALAFIIGGLIGRYAPVFDDDDNAQVQYSVTNADGTQSDVGTLTYSLNDGVLIFEAKSLPALPEGKVYQAWLINDEGPVSAGIIDSSTGNLATALPVDSYSTWAITIEEGPVGVGAPTSQPLYFSDLKQAD